MFFSRFFEVFGKIILKKAIFLNYFCFHPYYFSLILSERKGEKIINQ